MTLKSSYLDMPATLSDVLLVELNNDWCREAGEVAACDIDLPIGAVLARRDDGSYAPYLLAASDSKAVAMLITPVKQGPARRPCVVVRRGCVVAAAGLFFIPAASADEKKKAALASMEDRGLVPQE